MKNLHLLKTPFYALMLLLALSIALTVRADDFSNDDHAYEFSISKNNLNRISFKHKQLKINTISDAQIKVDRGSIYLLPGNDDSITLFVTPQDAPQLTYLVTLISEDIKAQDIKIPLPSSYLAKEEEKAQLKKLKLHTKTTSSPESNTISDSTTYQGAIAKIIREFWYNLDKNNEELIVNGYEVYGDELKAMFNIDFAKEKFCGSTLTEEVLSVTLTNDYALVLLSIANPLNIDTQIICEVTPLAWSVLNSTKVDKFGSKYVLVVLKKEELIDA